LNSLPPYNGSPTFSGALSNFLPLTSGQQPPPACSAGIAATACSIFAPQGIEPAARTPATNEWNLTIEQELGSGMAFRIGYVGSFGYHGFLSVDPNTIPPQICSTASCATGGTGAARGTVAQGEKYIPVLPAPVAPASSVRPNPYLGAGFFWLTGGNSSY